MNLPQEQHQREIAKNRAAWETKPLLQAIYRDFYAKILQCLDRALAGQIVEIGSGMGNLKSFVPEALCTDLFANPWLDAVCDAYEQPFQDGAVSHLVLFDVFHHLQYPRAFLREAQRVLAPTGRLILFEPYVSLTSAPVYGLFHHEPIGWRAPIDNGEHAPRPRAYYAAQGNATRLFFHEAAESVASEWRMVRVEAFSCFSYLLSGGFSKPALYPPKWLNGLRRVDTWFSRTPRLFAGRCLVVLTPRA